MGTPGSTARLILRKRHLPVLAEFAHANVLLAFDYDGTLAPIAPTPEEARMRRETRVLLTRVARRYPCVIISGRPLADLTRRFRRIPVRHVVGDHGFEPRGSETGPAPHVRHWTHLLRRHLPGRRGLVIEQKKNTVTVHYRGVEDRERAIRDIAEAITHLEDVRAVTGAEAVNLIHRRGPHKGVALQDARHALHCDRAVYIGDDDTDEDAFASGPPTRLLSIRVGTRRPSRAGFRLGSQLEIDRLLEAFLELRP